MANHDHHDPSQGSSNGKSKAIEATEADNNEAGSSSSKPAGSSLLRSAFAGATSSDVASSLSGYLADGGKAGSSSASSSAAQAASLASETTGASSSGFGQASGSGQRPLGPAQGFRTSGGTNTLPARDSQSGSFAAPNQASTISPPTSLSSGQYNSLESLDRGLHDLVRRSSGKQRDIGQGDSSSSFDSLKTTDYEALLQNEQLLNPAYHEAWARSIPGTMFTRAGQEEIASSSLPPSDQEAELLEAWDRSMGPSSDSNSFQTTVSSLPAPRQPTAEEPGGFMALLAADESAQGMTSTEQPTEKKWETELLNDFRSSELHSKQQEDFEEAAPRPEPSHLAQATDPREAMSFILGSGSTEMRAEMLFQLTDIRKRLEQESSSTSSLSADDKRSRRINRKRRLRQIEYEIELMQYKTSYTDEVYAPTAGVGYPVPPNPYEVEDGDGDEEVQEDAMEQRRTRAVERLESLRRHLAGKL